jgi:hypothetical protein
MATTFLQIPGWGDWENQGGGAAVADLTGDARPDLTVIRLDNAREQNRGFYRVWATTSMRPVRSGGWDPLADGVLVSVFGANSDVLPARIIGTVCGSLAFDAKDPEKRAILALFHCGPWRSTVQDPTLNGHRNIYDDSLLSVGLRPRIGMK